MTREQLILITLVLSYPEPWAIKDRVLNLMIADLLPPGHQINIRPPGLVKLVLDQDPILYPEYCLTCLAPTGSGKQVYTISLDCPRCYPSLTPYTLSLGKQRATLICLITDISLMGCSMEREYQDQQLLKLIYTQRGNTMNTVKQEVATHATI